MPLPATIPSVVADSHDSTSSGSRLHAVPATLDALAPGSRGILSAPEGLSPVVLRLLEMGLTPGTEITVTRRALGADPIEVRLRGTRICLRRADAARFPVRTLPPSREMP
jgi:Fe2+ transport system protein FeoA